MQIYRAVEIGATNWFTISFLFATIFSVTTLFANGLFATTITARYMIFVSTTSAIPTGETFDYVRLEFGPTRFFLFSLPTQALS